MIELTLIILAGTLILDVALEWWRDADRVRRRREIEHDRAEMRRTLHRTRGH